MNPLKEIGRKQKAMDKGAYQDALNRPVNAIRRVRRIVSLTSS